jgi:asparagine synthase (glutamine-hydrolysing)
MANSLEVRVPLLNRVFVDYVTTLPLNYKLKGFTRKYIFREALRGRLPDEILDRRKHGFGMPISKWLRSDLRALAEEHLSESRLRRDGLFEPAYVQGLLANHLAGRQDNRKPLWTLLVFQLWYDRYIASGDSTRASEYCDHHAVAGVA